MPNDVVRRDLDFVFEIRENEGTKLNTSYIHFTCVNSSSSEKKPFNADEEIRQTRFDGGE